MIFLLILAFIGVAAIEVPGLIRKKYMRELVVFSLFLLSAFILAFLQVIGVKIPSPVDGIEAMIKMLNLDYKP
jgi:hypothetical protein